MAVTVHLYPPRPPPLTPFSFPYPALSPGARTPLGEPHGATDLHSLVRLLRGRGGSSLAAAHMALPCPSLPADLQQLAAQLDERMQPPPHARAAPANSSKAAQSQGRGAQAGSGAGPASPAGPMTHGSLLQGTTAGLDLGRLAGLTPGVAVGLGPGPAGGEGLSLAETYTLRGASGHKERQYKPRLYVLYCNCKWSRHVDKKSD